jgi:hypothetical protein
MRYVFTYCLVFALLNGCVSSEDAEQYQTDSQSLQSPRAVITASDVSKEDTVYTEEAELIFSKNFTETLTRTIYPTDLLTIRYTLDRMIGCEKRGRDYLQTVTGYYQVDNQPPKAFEYIPTYTTASRTQVSKIRVPEGKNLAFWFYSVDSYGCEAWDSNLGHNYHVPITQDPSTENTEFDVDTLIDFKSNGEITQNQPLRNGTNVTIRYDLNRLNKCESVQNQIAQWGITGHFKTDLSEEVFFTVTENKEGERVAVDTDIEIPEGNVLYLWFTATNRYGCFEEDQGASFEIKQD